MKNLLYGTTALFAIGLMVGSAVAAEKIKLGLGGYWRGMAQFGDNESDTPGDDSGLRDHGFGQESEIFFKGSTTLDNGIRFGVSIDLEGETAADQIDNTYIWASGQFGRVEFGETWGPSLLMNYGGVGEKNHTGDFASFNPQVALNGLGLNSFTGGAGISGLPTEKIAYYTPRMAGIQIGISYAPEPKNANANGTRDSDSGTAAVAATDDNPGGQDAKEQKGTEAIDIGVNFTKKFGEANVSLFGSFTNTETEPAGVGGVAGADVDAYSIGGQVGFSGFRVGGRYTKVEDLGGRGLDRTNWRAGIDYATGPWGLGITYQNAEQEVTTSTADVTEYVSIGGSYTVGPGISMGAGMVFFDYDDATNAVANEGDNSFGIIWTRFVF